MAIRACIRVLLSPLPASEQEFTKNHLIMKYFTLALMALTLVLQSCKDEECMVVDTAIQIYYIDENGEDLLDPEHEYAISAENLEIYYLEGGEKKRVYDPNMDYPKNFSIKTDANGQHYLSLTVSHHVTEGVSTTYLEVAERGMMDELRTEIQRSECMRAIGKAWYNDELVWEGENQPVITIEKQNPIAL